jgi:hypothetical protein
MTRNRLLLTNSVIAVVIITVLTALFFQQGFADSDDKNTSMLQGYHPGTNEDQKESPEPTQVTKPEEQRRVELSLDNRAANSSPGAPLSEPLVSEAALSFMLDDGQGEDAIGVYDQNNHDIQFIWFNRFTPTPSAFPFYLTEIRILFFGTGISSGLPIDLVVYEDLDGSTPDNANWLASYQATTLAADGSTWSAYTLDPPLKIDGPGDVLVGAINRYTNSGIDPQSYPARIDLTSSQSRSWIGWWTTDPPQPPILPSNGKFDLIDNEGYPGNWMIRAYGETQLTAPNLIAPTNGITITDNPPQFEWSSVAGATQYRLQVDNDINFLNPAVDITTTNLTYSPPLPLIAGQYYWRVQANAGSGLWGLWSSPAWSFTVETANMTVFLPISINKYINFFEGPWEVEPNNSAQEANGAIRSGRDYFGYPDEKDYFSFYLNEAGSITIDLANHTGNEVQLQLFYQDVDHRVAFKPSPPFHIELANQPPGLYFIYIFAKSGFNQQNEYTLKVLYP